MSYSDVLKQWQDNSSTIDIKTSGSTGQPKIIRIEKALMEVSARMSLQYFNLKEGDKVLLALPTDKIGGFMLAVRAIIGGLEVVEVIPRLDPLQNTHLDKINFCSLTPSQLQAILKNRDSTDQLKKIEKVLLGGSAVSSQTLTSIKDLPNTFYHSFGMTETISHIAIKNLTNGDSYYHALDEVEFRSNSVSQLIIDAPLLKINGLKTNDLVELNGPKEMKWRGRLDNVVNSGGVKVLLEEVEAKIRLTFDSDFYLTKEEDNDFGERVVMVSKAEPPSSMMSQLNKFERPKEIFVTDAFSYTENGKLLRLTPQQLKDL